MAPLLAEVTAALGCEQWAPLQAHICKLLIYEEGCCLRRHRDNDRAAGRGLHSFTLQLNLSYSWTHS